MSEEHWTMIERVAEALWMENRPTDAPPYDELDFLDQGRVKMIARACIKAMREPTEEMIQVSIGDADFARENLTDVWQQMIDAALMED